MIGDDLVNSYHLLLCCLDLVFGNAMLCSNRKDLINPLFKGRAMCRYNKWSKEPKTALPCAEPLLGVQTWHHRLCVLCFLVTVATPGLPKDWPDTASSGQPPCVIDKLCELHDGLVVEAKGIKEHYFKPYIKRLFERKVSPFQPFV